MSAENRRLCSRAMIGLLGLSLCAFAPAQARADVPETLGGPASVHDESRNAFGFPARILSALERRRFMAGNAIFKANWVPAPASSQSRDGLGPLFDARSCSSCHALDGRGRPPEPGEEGPTGLLLRIGVSGSTSGADRPHPIYGEQLQPRGIPGVPGEVSFRIRRETLPGEYGDGTAYTLEEPYYELFNWAYGEPSSEIAIGPRVGSPLIGLGLLEAVPVLQLEALADPDDADGDGISGRLHWLPAATGEPKRLGRFGWKATQPTVAAQIAAAFAGDMGLTTSLHPKDDRTERQQESTQSPSGGDPEVTDDQLALVSFYCQTLAVPKRRQVADEAVRRGAALFEQFGCASCHTPTLTTGQDAVHPALANVRFHPFTDLLLHDMGPALADPKRDGDAAPSEWRTPPLWGLGLTETVSGHERLLHDGRARGIAEAILWHGGEAEKAREAFRQAPSEEREALLKFLRSL